MADKPCSDRPAEKDDYRNTFEEDARYILRRLANISGLNSSMSRPEKNNIL